MNEKQMVKADFLTSIVLLVFGITATWMAWNMPRFEEKGVNPYTAPGVVPGSLGIVITLLALILLVRSLRRGDFLPRFSRRQMKDLVQNDSWIRLMVTLVLCLVYALILIGRIPYWLATFLFIISFLLSFELKFDKTGEETRKVVLKSVLQSVITTVLVTSAFQYLFLVDLP